MAVIGCGVRGAAHVQGFGPQKGLRMAAVCDPDSTRSAAFVNLIETRFGYRPDAVTDVRRSWPRMSGSQQ